MEQNAALPTASKAAWQIWLRKAAQLYKPELALPVCFAGGLLLPSVAMWGILFYILLLPSVLVRLGQGWRPNLRNPIIVIMLVLWGWSTLGIIWDQDLTHHGHNHGYWLGNAFCTLAFLLCYFMADDDAALLPRLVSALIGAAAVNGLISVVIFVAAGDFHARLLGWGATRNPVLGATIMDICFLLALGRLGVTGRGRLYYAAYTAAIIPIGLYLACSFSRMALITLVCTLLILAFGSWQALRRSVLAVCVLAVLALLACWAKPGLPLLIEHNLFARGTDCHLTIWETAWGLIQANPVIGYGPSALLPILPHGYCPAYPHPHDLYLSLLLYSGIIGLALFGICQLLVLRHLHRVADGFRFRLWFAVMAVPLIAGLTDLTQLIKGPAAVWYIIWLPLLMVMSLRQSPDTSPASSASPPRG